MLASMDIAGLTPIAALAVATLAGAASFLSPCVAPLLPGYVAFVAGGSVEHERGARPRAIGGVAGVGGSGEQTPRQQRPRRSAAQGRA